MSPSKIKNANHNPELKAALLEKQLSWKVVEQQAPRFIAEPATFNAHTVTLDADTTDVFAKHFDVVFPSIPDTSNIQPVKFQGDTQACTSFALASTIEDRLRLTEQVKLTVSAHYIHFCIAKLSLDSPWDLTYAMKYDVPDANFALSEPGDAQSLPAQCSVRKVAVSLKNISPVIGDIAARTALQKGPIIASMEDWEDFHKFYGGGIYRHASGGERQSHTIEVIGFDSESWIVKNSWGTSWGEGGLARIAFGECNLFKLAAFSFEPELI
ncbi:C1 family peptidase [Pseudomonas sp. TWP3-2]|uniref:C1 family peptidase n=1 Tax=Pseudomonas sp. TWP3-2 TaxID=2804574 RepID=UPI003CF31587